MESGNVSMVEDERPVENAVEGVGWLILVIIP